MMDTISCPSLLSYIVSASPSASEWAKQSPVSCGDRFPKVEMTLLH